MIQFFGEVGKKLADRWVAMLAIPGLLYLAVVITAAVLGQNHPFDYSALSKQITTWAASPTFKAVGGAVLIVVAILIGSVAAGLAAAVLGSFIEAIWLLPGGSPIEEVNTRRGLVNVGMPAWLSRTIIESPVSPGKWLVDFRISRSRKAEAIAEDPSATPSQVARAIATADRISFIAPECPTWIADRFRTCHIRVYRTYGLNLRIIWPRLWLILPDSVRTEIGAASDIFSTSARLAAWAIMYLVLALWWWPAVLIAIIAGTVATINARLAATNLTSFIESAVDLYGRDLAVKLGVIADGPLTATLGRNMTSKIQKSRWDPGSPMAD